MSEAFRTTEMTCPHCKAVVDTHTNVTGDKPPVDGRDISICFYCHTFLTFKNGGIVIGSKKLFRECELDLLMITLTHGITAICRGE